MKGKTLKPLIIAALVILFAPVVSQDRNMAEYGNSEDSIDCKVYLSVYREFFRLKLFEETYEPWWKVFNNCPESSEQMYVDGVTMYRSFIEAAPEGPVREGLIDTLMMIYDRRMEYYGGEGNVLGRKGRDLLNYRNSDIEQVQKAYEMLKRSLELEGSKSPHPVMFLYISSGISLKKEGKLETDQIIDDYLMVSEILGQMEGMSSRQERARATIDDIMLKEGILDCEVLNHYYEPKFEQNKNDRAFLETVIKLYTSSGCDRSNIYVAASENFYIIEPGPVSAHNLAILFITKNDFEKAASYLKEAVQGKGIDDETKAAWYYELAVISNANKEYCESINYAREAIKLKSNYGKAYILLGDAFIASRNNLGDEFQQRTAFWAAADKYKKAASVDSSVAQEANQKLTDYASQYPNHEDVFFRDFKEDDPYLVEGCINENTTIRSRK